MGARGTSTPAWRARIPAEALSAVARAASAKGRRPRRRTRSPAPALTTGKVEHRDHPPSRRVPLVRGPPCAGDGRGCTMHPDMKPALDLTHGKPAVVTGQQAGLLGGPLFTLGKLLGAIALARSTGAVPVFWIECDDADIKEVDQVRLLDDEGTLRTLT